MMTPLKFRYARLAIVASLLISVAPVGAAEQEKAYEDFASAKFDRSLVIDNKWFPLKPGTQYTWEGTTVDDEGDQEPHTVIFTVTDLIKEIDGVRTVVCWDRDFADDELEEAEIVFFAQDNNGNVWHLGQYPEEYDNGKVVAAPTWLHGINDGKAGIMMKAEPKLGAPSYSQGLSLSTRWTDRAVAFQVGQKTTVPYGSFDNVLVIQEWDQEEPHARQLKYYAPGMGNIRVGWRAEKDKDQEVLELVKVEQLDADELAKAREEALELEKRAYEASKDVYAKSNPSERNPAAGPETGRPAASKRPNRKISDEKAIEIALKKVPGQATGVSLEKKAGKLSIVVEVQADTGVETDVIIDMETGEVTGTET
jgi:uncharacterized membrane protein YkoI